VSNPTSTSDPLIDILKRLKDRGVPFVIVGGYAAVAHGSPLPTYDMDVCSPLDPATASLIIDVLQPLSPKWRDRPDQPVVRPDNSNLLDIKNMSLVPSHGRFDVLGHVAGVGDYLQ